LTVTDAQWEYKTVKVNPNRRVMQRELNRLGKQGWELVDVQKKGTFEWGTKSTLTLRRPREMKRSLTQRMDDYTQRHTPTTTSVVSSGTPLKRAAPSGRLAPDSESVTAARLDTTQGYPPPPKASIWSQLGMTSRWSRVGGVAVVVILIASVIASILEDDRDERSLSDDQPVATIETTRQTTTTVRTSTVINRVLSPDEIELVTQVARLWYSMSNGDRASMCADRELYGASYPARAREWVDAGFDSGDEDLLVRTLMEVMDRDCQGV
jgi:hypothetical protein